MTPRFFSTIFLIAFLQFLAFGQDGHKVVFELSEYHNDTLTTGYFYGERQLVLDTLYKDDKGKFTLTGEDPLDPGVYLFLTQGENGMYQFIMPREDQNFTVISDTPDHSDLRFKGSAENELFYSYVDFLEEKRPIITALQQKQVEAPDAEKQKIQDEIVATDGEVKALQQKIIDEKPESITALLLRANQEVVVPDFEDEEESKRSQLRYRFYKEHYFDNIDLTDSVTLFTPFIHERIRYYLDKLTLQSADSLNQGLDHLYSMMGPDSKMFRYYLGELYNFYASSKIVGMDGVVVHLVDNYYAKGKAPWVSDETLEKITDNVAKIKPTLIGQIAQDITVYKEDGSPISIDSIDYEYLVLMFWAPDCGHCKKIMPAVVEFGKNYKDKGVEVFAICTKHMEKMKTCWEALEDKDMLGFVNAADEYHRSKFKTKYDVRTTPKIFILDKDKKILIKGIGGEQLSEVMDEIIKMDKSGTE